MDAENNIRIGLAHGSLDIMPLPDDDHLIRRDAVDYYGLDYLALGHWHRRSLHKSFDGAYRTAYSGTHEPMGFPWGISDGEIGWASYSTDGNAERFHDDGHGTALLVSIEEPKAPPQITPVDIRRLHWTAEQRDLTELSVGSLINDYANRPGRELTILRLRLAGVIEPHAHTRLEELRQIIERGYHPGSSFDADEVHIEPNPEQLLEVVGNGVLKRVLQRLKDDNESTDPSTKRITGHALKLLYRIAWEEQPA